MVFVSVNFSPHKGENMKISFTRETWRKIASHGKLIRKLLHKRHKKIVSQESLQRSCLAGIRLENFDRNCYTRKTRQLLHRGSLKLGA
jgi:hypothetical protein